MLRTFQMSLVEMNWLARYDEIASMTLQGIKETKCNWRTHAHTQAHIYGYKKNIFHKHSLRRGGGV